MKDCNESWDTRYARKVWMQRTEEDVCKIKVPRTDGEHARKSYKQLGKHRKKYGITNDVDLKSKTTGHSRGNRKHQPKKRRPPRKK